MDPERPREKERQKFLLLGLGAAITLAVIDFADLRVIRLLNPVQTAAVHLLDYWLTWLIVFAGADRIRDLLQGVKASPIAERKETPAVRIHVEGAAEVRELRPAS